MSQARERVAVAGGTMARVLQATLDALAGPRAQRDDVVHEAMLREIPGVERFSSAILVFAAVAPLLGLLGTVTGMISTFDVITEFGTGDPRMLSGGISEALITTKLGLVVAIPALLAGTLLNGRADALLASIQYGTLRVLNAADRDKEHAAPSTAAKTNAAESALAFGAPVTGSS
jgi:biopolymer transport protein ExbB